jgi:hypothetical protein
VIERPFEAVRSACAELARRARTVRIDSARLQTYADEIPADAVRSVEGPRLPEERDPETLCAFVLTLDAVNFGSGWFPFLRKRPGLSGYRTIEASLLDRFAAGGPLDCDELSRISVRDCADLFGQSPDDREIAPLLELFAQAWRDLGHTVAGSFAAFVAACDGSAAGLVRRLLAMPLYRDIHDYDELRVPLLKRAQLTVADLHTVLPEGAGAFSDIDDLTLFADNLVPHVLRLDGVLVVDPAVVARIERGELLEPGSPQEVELRAVAVHAVERLSERTGLLPRELDYWLWNRGSRPEYKAVPRPRARCPYY